MYKQKARILPQHSRLLTWRRAYPHPHTMRNYPDGFGLSTRPMLEVGMGEGGLSLGLDLACEGDVGDTGLTSKMSTGRGERGSVKWGELCPNSPKMPKSSFRVGGRVKSPVDIRLT